MFEKGDFVYISHPYRDNKFKNYLKVRLIINALKDKYPDVIFMAVHLYLPHFFHDEELDQEKIRLYYLKFLSLSDVMVIFGNRITEGMRVELDYCEKEKNIKGNKIKIIYADEELYKQLNISKNFIEEE